MRALQHQPSLQQRHDLLKVSLVLVQLEKRLELLGMDDQVETAHLGELEVLPVEARCIDLLPYP